MQSDLARPLLEGNLDTPVPSWQTRVPGIATAVSVVAVHLTIGTAMFYNLRTEGLLDIPTSLYFAVTTFLTIGYGDIHPDTPATKIFFIVYIVASLAVQATVGGYVVASFLSIRKEEKLPHRQAHTSMYLRIRPKIMSLVFAAGTLVLLVAVGTVMLHVMDDRSWLDSVYWACVTLTTVGYGDITPGHHKALFAMYCLLGVLAFANVFAEVISIVVEVQMIRRLQKFFQHGFDRGMLQRMDEYKDGQISRYEFIIFMLRDMDIASDEQIERITGIFDSLDVNRDGVLNVQDIRNHCQEESTAFPTDAGATSSAVPQRAATRQEEHARDVAQAKESARGQQEEGETPGK